MLVARIKLFAALFIIFEISTFLFWSNKIIFRSMHIYLIWATFLDISVKPFIPCNFYRINKNYDNKLRNNMCKLFVNEV